MSVLALYRDENVVEKRIKNIENNAKRISLQCKRYLEDSNLKKQYPAKIAKFQREKGRMRI